MESGSAYQNMVKRRMLAEGKDPNTFEPVFGREIEFRNPICRYIRENTISNVFSWVTERFITNLKGKWFTRNRASGYEAPAMKEDDDSGGIENKVIIRSYDIGNITRIKANSEELHHDEWRNA